MRWFTIWKVCRGIKIDCQAKMDHNTNLPIINYTKWPAPPQNIPHPPPKHPAIPTKAMTHPPQPIPIRQITSQSCEWSVKYILNLDPSHIHGEAKRHSLLLTKTSSEQSENAVMEDRFIPSRKLIQEFDFGENNMSEESPLEVDPQTMSVAEIFS